MPFIDKDFFFLSEEGSKPEHRYRNFRWVGNRMDNRRCPEVSRTAQGFSLGLTSTHGTDFINTFPDQLGSRGGAYGSLLQLRQRRAAGREDLNVPQGGWSDLGACQKKQSEMMQRR